MRRKKRCCWCLEFFWPNPRLGDKQKSCGHPLCKQKQSNESHVQWKLFNEEIYLQGQKDWRRQNPDYWRIYRSDHPDYVAKNRKQTKIRKAFALKKGLQKRIDILQPFEKQMQFWSLPRFAKENRSLTPLLYAISETWKLRPQNRLLC